MIAGISEEYGIMICSIILGIVIVSIVTIVFLEAYRFFFRKPISDTDKVVSQKRWLELLEKADQIIEGKVQIEDLDEFGELVCTVLFNAPAMSESETEKYKETLERLGQQLLEMVKKYESVETDNKNLRPTKKGKFINTPQLVVISIGIAFISLMAIIIFYDGTTPYHIRSFWQIVLYATLVVAGSVVALRDKRTWWQICKEEVSKQEKNPQDSVQGAKY